MKTTKIIGYAGIISLALAFSANSPTIADTQFDTVSSTAGVEKSATSVHRVTHTLASTQQYTGSSQSGYKWGQKAQVVDSKTTWISSEDSLGGYKWGRPNKSEQAGSKWGQSNTAEQAGSKWGRASTTEQAGSKWGRANAAEQAGSKWGRANTAEQAGSKWGRANIDLLTHF